MSYDDFDDNEPKRRQKPSGATVFITPKWIIDLAGPFDMDVCASKTRPFDCAKKNITVEDDGLKVDWEGFVWCFPPYGLQFGEKEFARKMARHNNGLMMLNARTANKIWNEYVFPFASGYMFFNRRIHYLNRHGEEGPNMYGDPVLISYGARARGRLEKFYMDGTILERANKPHVRQRGPDEAE
jgi:hypothetical protein